MENTLQLVTVMKNQAVTTSRIFAEIFHRQHKNVLQSIEEILVAEKLAAKYFHKTTYENRGKQYPEYLMNFDGFSILVMGFNGKNSVSTSLTSKKLTSSSTTKWKSGNLSLTSRQKPDQSSETQAKYQTRHRRRCWGICIRPQSWQ